jgi:DNA primase
VSGKTIPGRLGIPIHNPAGEPVAYAGRWVGSDEAIPEDQGKYQLPAQFHKNVELFNLHRVKDCQTLTIVEGFFGAIRLYGSLRPRIPAVALMGSSISEEQLSLLRAHCPALRFVTVCLDGDDAGRKASDLVAARLARHWWVRIATLGDGMQPDTAPEAELLAVLGRKR